MRCAILTEGMLEAAVRRQLSADRRDALLRHLREPCEGCLDLLEGMTAEEMMLPPDDLPTAQERDAFFQRTTRAALPAGPRVLRLMHPERRPRPRLAWGAAAALALAALGAVVAVVQSPQPDSEVGLKGVPVQEAQLVPLVGARAPTPHVARALPPGGHLTSGELLLLRIRLAAPAWAYLLSQKQGEAAELLWPLQAAARHDAGEFEVAEAGSALAIDPGALGPGGRILLVACPKSIERRRLEVREPLRTREDLERAFAGCAVDLLPVIVEPH